MIRRPEVRPVLIVVYHTDQDLPKDGLATVHADVGRLVTALFTDGD